MEGKKCELGDEVQACFDGKWIRECTIKRIVGKHMHVQIPGVLGDQYGCRLLPPSVPNPDEEAEDGELLLLDVGDDEAGQ